MQFHEWDFVCSRFDWIKIAASSHRHSGRVVFQSDRAEPDETEHEAQDQGNRRKDGRCCVQSCVAMCQWDVPNALLEMGQ